MRLPRQGLYANLVILEEAIALALRLEMNAKLRIDDVTDSERTLSRSILKRAGRLRHGRFVATRIEQDVRVDATIIDPEYPQ